MPEPPRRYGGAATAPGIVKFYKSDKGWGAITIEGTEPHDVFCHFSSIDGEGFLELRQGQRVTVEYERRDQDSFRYVAVSVRLD